MWFILFQALGDQTCLFYLKKKKNSTLFYTCNCYSDRTEKVSMMLKWIYDESWQIYIYIFIAVQIWSMYSTSKMSLLENTVIWHHWDTDYWWFQICHLHIWPECTSMQYIQDLNCLYFIHIHNGDFHHKHLVSTIKTWT
jgi:hypothetical protein